MVWDGKPTVVHMIIFDPLKNIQKYPNILLCTKVCTAFLCITILDAENWIKLQLVGPNRNICSKHIMFASWSCVELFDETLT